jgi:dolichyl-phosphate-mannose-protein mannosyltransferase
MIESLLTSWRTRVALFTVALGGALASAAATGWLFAPEHWEYSEIAENLLQGRGAYCEFLGTKYYLYGSWLYPRFLASVLWMTGGREAIMVVIQGLLFAATSVNIYGIGRLIFGRVEGVIAGLLWTFHPGGLVYVGKLHSQTLDVLLITWSVFLLLRLVLEPRWDRAVLAGGIAGLSVISRGTIAPFYASWVVVMIYAWRRQLGLVLPAVGWLAVGCVAVVLPVLGDGYARYGRLVPLRSDTGVNLWIGNHEGASGTSFVTGSDRPALNMQPQALVDRLAGTDEIAQNDLFSAEAVRFVRQAPGEFTTLLAKKLWYFWWQSPHLGLLYPQRWTAIYMTYYAVMALAALAGLVRFSRSSRTATLYGVAMFVLIGASYSFTQALFYIEGRHRWQIEPLLLVFSAPLLLQLARLAGSQMSGLSVPAAFENLFRKISPSTRSSAQRPY